MEISAIELYFFGAPCCPVASGFGWLMILIVQVPSNDYEALRSPLMGLFEKRRARSFFL